MAPIVRRKGALRVEYFCMLNFFQSSKIADIAPEYIMKRIIFQNKVLFLNDPKIKDVCLCLIFVAMTPIVRRKGALRVEYFCMLNSFKSSKIAGSGKNLMSCHLFEF